MYSEGHRSDKTASVPAITLCRPPYTNVRDGLSKVQKSIQQQLFECITKQNNVPLIRST